MEFLFPDDGRGIYAAHTYATGDFVSVRSASTSSGNLPCLCCARHHVTSRHAALRHSRAFPSIASQPASRSKTHQGTPPRKINHVLSPLRRHGTPPFVSLAIWSRGRGPWMSARRRPHVLFSRCLRHTNFSSSIALTCRDRKYVRIAVAGQVTVSSSVVRRCVLAAGWLPGARPRPPTAGPAGETEQAKQPRTRARARARRQIKAS